MRFWDSSALVPLLVEEPATSTMIELRRSDPAVAVWWSAEVECASAIARLERDGTLSAAAADKAFARLRVLVASWHEVEPSIEIREVAVRVLRLHALRSADALQLGAAFIAAERRPPTLEFVCLDDRLARAAGQEGFQVTPGMPL
jgi:predicted nucleic acid-binding protein